MSEAPTISEPKLFVVLMRQDDPRKCTAAKLARLRLSRPLYRAAQIPRRSIVLNPFSSMVVLPKDGSIIEAYGLVAVDCSWEKADSALATRLPGSGRRLPTLLASNPTNYAKQHKLSSAEAMAAALYITGFVEPAKRLLSPFKWGNTFFTLNHEPLDSYSQAKTPEEMAVAESEFF
ncbi:MAG: DUF367 family protein [Candidatus Bathyarchaeia archaeon]